MGIQVAPTDTRYDMGSIICLFPAYSASQSFVFVFSCGIRVASMSNVDSIPFLSGVLIFLCEYQSFRIIEIVMSILFNRCVSLQVDPIIFNIRKINSKSSQRYLFHLSQVAFVFLPAHPFLQGFRFLNHVSFYL